MKRLFFGLVSILVMHHANAMFTSGSKKVAKYLLSQTLKKNKGAVNNNSVYFSPNAGDKKSKEKKLIDVLLIEKNQKLDSLQEGLKSIQLEKQEYKRGSIALFSAGIGLETLSLGVDKFCDLGCTGYAGLSFIGGTLGVVLMIAGSGIYFEGRTGFAKRTKEVERKVANILEQKEILEKLKLNKDENK